jgi:hypothetical protein
MQKPSETTPMTRIHIPDPQPFLVGSFVVSYAAILALIAIPILIVAIVATEIGDRIWPVRR